MLGMLGKLMDISMADGPLDKALLIAGLTVPSRSELIEFLMATSIHGTVGGEKGGLGAEGGEGGSGGHPMPRRLQKLKFSQPEARCATSKSSIQRGIALSDVVGYYTFYI